MNTTEIWVNKMEDAIIAELISRKIYTDYGVELSNSCMASKSLYITLYGTIIGRISDHESKSEYYNPKASYQTGNFNTDDVPKLIETILNETAELRAEIEAEY